MFQIERVKMVVPRSFGTHDGSFHADEVTACSLLLCFDLIDRDKVQRSRNLSVLSSLEYVCDVGGVYDPSQKRFDHHQADYKGSFSSAGMVLLYLKESKIIDPHLYDLLHHCLISGVDAHDNGVAKTEPGITTFSHIVSNFLPIEYEATDKEMQQAFWRAVDFVLGHLKRKIARAHYTRDCIEIVQKAMLDTGKALIFDQSIPWMDNFFELGGEVHPAQFVVMPSGGHWKLRGIPPSLNDRMKVRRPLPANWAGLHEEDLRKVTGISGAVFCHKGRFISIWETKEDAIKALHMVLKR